MKNFAVELLNVSTPDGDAIFLTNRNDDRTPSYLARTVPKYFPGCAFINKVLLAPNLTKIEGELALAKFLTVYESLGSKILNTRTAKGRKLFELVDSNDD